MIVLDCNAAISMALGTAEGQALAALTLSGERIIAPQLFCVELSHVLTKYIKSNSFSVEIAREKGGFALGFVDEFYEDANLCIEALSESVRLGHSSYDMFYFVLARRTGSTLFTLDKTLATLCKQEGVDCLHETHLIK